ncbi:hypothetical protein MLD38_001227 [Melastoma candidum]|uniref:Uncharacterized protein n=1 Tax=Melastoma candidum TaxID=119954 RepID=A0ACB9SL65_9MYRT|nr:hypothetical protein MLD38_001227 [Melastoma candidum]
MSQNPFSIRFLMVLAVIVLVSRQAVLVGAVTCNPTELSSCLPAITSSSQPTAQCCAKLREQQPCLCGYATNPSLKQYVTSPNAKKVANTCGLSIPSC